MQTKSTDKLAEYWEKRGIIGKTNYKKQRPNLKRHYPEEWGRFLDNHYDPQTHQRPFTIAMKAPDLYFLVCLTFAIASTDTPKEWA